MAIDKEVFYASHGLIYPVVAKPYTDDMVVKEKFFTKDDMVDMLDKIRAEIDEVYEELDGYDPHSLGTFASRIDEIFDKYKAGSEGEE